MPANPHLVPAPVRHGAPAARADLVVLGLHGRGQDPAFVAGVADRLDLPGLGWLLPAADAGSWYPESFLVPVERNRPRLDQALEAVAAHLAGLHRDGVGPERTVLLGFSQGTCVLVEHLLRSRRRYAAAVLLTGGYVDPASPAATRADGTRPLAGMPVLLACSDRDEFVPLERVHPTADALAGLGADVDVRIDDDPVHQVNDETVRATRELLVRLRAPHPHRPTTPTQNPTEER